MQRNEIESYLIGALGEEAKLLLYADMYRDSKMMSLAANPLMLWLISVVAQTSNDSRLPSNKGRLFQQFVSDMPRLRASEALGRRIPFDVVISVLAKLSFEMLERRKLTVPLASVRSYCLPDAGFSLEEILAQGKEWRFLKSDGGMGDDLEFLHQLFLEYFAAAHLNSQLRTGQSFSDVVGKHHASEWWGEVITMLAGIADQESELVLWLSDQAILSGQANLAWLAARCLEASAALTNERACRSVAAAIALFVDDERIQYSEPPRVLRSIGRFAVGPLIDALKRANFNVRNGIFRCLLATGVSGLEMLISKLNDEDDEDAEARIIAAEVLGGMRNTRAIEPLLVALRDQNCDLQIAASIALSQLGPDVIKSLVVLLSLNCERSRCAAVKTLGRFNDVRVIAPLVDRLQDEDPDVRRETAKALGESSSFQALARKRFLRSRSSVMEYKKALRTIKTVQPSRMQALEMLKTVLNSQNPSDREFGAFALGKVGGWKAADLLSLTLRDKEAEVRYRAISALDAIYEKTGIVAANLDHLIAALGDEDSFVRCRAFWLVRRMDCDLERPLFKALESDDVNTRTYALTVLMTSVLGVGKSFFLVLRVLETQPSEVRKQALILWDRFGVGIIAPLVIALRDDNEDVRAVAAAALARIENHRSLEALTMALGDTSSKVKCLAVFGLSKAQDERAIVSLIGALSDNDPEVRWLAADALYHVRDRRALPELRRIANEDHTETRFGNVAEAARNAVKRIRVS